MVRVVVGVEFGYPRLRMPEDAADPAQRDPFAGHPHRSRMPQRMRGAIRDAGTASGGVEPRLYGSDRLAVAGNSMRADGPAVGALYLPAVGDIDLV
nr:hypothetical protein [Azospirillum halopraeferens]